MTRYGEKLIEAMARALADCSDDTSEFYARDYYRQEARTALAAALDALQEPSEAMADSGESSLICSRYPGDLEASWAHAKSCFRAMLAALRQEIGDG